MAVARYPYPMTRRDELEALADRVATFEGVERAWVANSFQDTLLFVEVERDRALPDAVAELLDDWGLTGANEAYDIDTAEGPSNAGNVGAYEQHRFVDTDGSDPVLRRSASR